MRRRRLIQLAALSAGLSWLPRWATANSEAGSSDTGRVLVLVELAGGNDGLNTVVPLADPEYHRLRPLLAVERDHILPLSDWLGLNPSLQPLMPAWAEGDLAWVLGLGYPAPNRSHFRSIDIWESGSGSDQILTAGWVDRGLPVTPDDGLPDVVILGGGDGAARGGVHRVVSLGNPGRFVREAAGLKVLEGMAGQSDALAHILKVRASVRRTGADLLRYLDGLGPLPVEFPRSLIGEQLRQAARMLIAGLQFRVVKVSLGGFDTHSNQRGQHDRLLAVLAEALAAFRQVLRGADLWDRVLVMSYSEFGRRVAENGSRGTDHGTAAPHFVLGGKVKGGLYGEQPALADLDRGDLRYTTDYRRLYTTVAQRWWGGADVEWQQRFPSMEFL